MNVQIIRIAMDSISYLASGITVDNISNFISCFFYIFISNNLFFFLFTQRNYQMLALRAFGFAVCHFAKLHISCGYSRINTNSIII